MKKNQEIDLKTSRNSSFEILRIVAMLFIIGHHFVWYGGQMNIDFSEGINRYIAQFLFIGGNLGVDIFFIISGYFLVSGQFKVKKLIKLDLAIIFYSVISIIIVTFALHNKQQVYTWLQAFFPLSLESYWFMTIYAAIYLLSPCFNKLINQLDKKHFTAIVVIMFFFVCIRPAIAFPKRLTIFNGCFPIGIYGYFMGAYLRKYPIKFLDNIAVSFIVFILSYIVLGLVSVYGYKYDDINIMGSMKDIFFAHESIFMLICSISALMFVKNIKIGKVVSINFIAQAMFGVYIIHEAPVLRGYIWNNILHAANITHNNYYILYAMKIILALFISCTIIELIRIYMIEKPLFKSKRFDKQFERIDNFMNRI